MDSNSAQPVVSDSAQTTAQGNTTQPAVVSNMESSKTNITTSSYDSSVGTVATSYINPIRRDRLHLAKGGNQVIDSNGEVVGTLEFPTVFERKFWENLRSGFRSMKTSALLEYASSHEVHMALSSIGELFVINGSLIAGFSLNFLQIVDLNTVGTPIATPAFLFITLAFMGSITSVLIAMILFLGVATVPVSHIHLFAAHVGSWILRPAQLTYLCFILLCGEFVTISWTLEYISSTILVTSITGIAFVLMGILAIVHMTRVVVVRDFVKEDVRRAREERKKQKKLIKKMKRQQRAAAIALFGKRGSNASAQELKRNLAEQVESTDPVKAGG